MYISHSLLRIVLIKSRLDPVSNVINVTKRTETGFCQHHRRSSHTIMPVLNHRESNRGVRCCERLLCLLFIRRLCNNNYIYPLLGGSRTKIHTLAFIINIDSKDTFNCYFYFKKSSLIFILAVENYIICLFV